jgi:hypothetical protein
LAGHECDGRRVCDIVVANLLSVIAEAGFNWDLPSDPVGYLLFKK